MATQIKLPSEVSEEIKLPTEDIILPEGHVIDNEHKGFYESFKEALAGPEELWEQSYLGKALRYTVPRLMAPWEDWDAYEEKQRRNKSVRNYLTKGLSIKEAEEQYKTDKEIPEEDVAWGDMADALGTAIKEDPGKVTAMAVNAVLSDPELMATPIGWSRAAAQAGISTAKYGKVVQKVSEVAAGATGAATTGAAIFGGLGTMAQLADTGEIDSEKVKSDLAIGAIFGTAFAGGAKIVEKGVKALAGRAGKDVDAVTAKVAKDIDSGIDPEEAIDKVATSLGFSEQEIVKQAGTISPKTLGITALLSGAGVAGYMVDNKWDDSVGTVLAVGGVLAGAKALKNIAKTASKGVSPQKDLRVGGLIDYAEGEIAVSARHSWQYKEDIKKLIPDQSTREKMSFWLDGDKSIPLSKEELAVAGSVRKFFDEVHAKGKAEGVLDSYLDDYVTHIWDRGGKSRSELMKSLESKGFGKSPKTRFSKERTIETLQEGIDAGLTPVTLDIADIAKVYSDSVNRAISNKKLVSALMKEEGHEGNRLLMRTDKAPDSYVTIDHPALRRTIAIPEGTGLTKVKLPVKVHPDIAASLKAYFDATDPGGIERGLLAINFASKRMLVSTSLFHANALIESTLMAGNMPKLLKTFRGKSPALEMLRYGKAGDQIDELLAAGLKIGTIDDVGTDVFYSALRDLENVMGKSTVTKPVQYAVKGFEGMNRFVDKIMWDRIATGYKVTTALAKYEKLIVKYPNISKEQLAKDVASFTNDAFGGLNWRQIAEGVENKYFRKIALEAFSPSGRRKLQLALFAPDWTIANIRVLAKAIPGVAKNKRIARMHQAYAARGAFMFLVAGDAVNLAMSGHHLWENEDPTYVDLGDGRRMTFSKQFVEPAHWVRDPAGTLLNKAGILPKFVGEQLLSKKYLNSKYSPAMYKKNAKFSEKAAARLDNIRRKFTPIVAQQAEQQGIDAIWGFFGHPIYGKAKK